MPDFLSKKIKIVEIFGKVANEIDSFAQSGFKGFQSLRLF